MSKVIVGMSGGVDSAVTAYLLHKNGYEVIGVTLRSWVSETGEEGRCCEIDDARRAANALGIRYVALNCLSEFKKKVTEPFVRAYLEGMTPNPCVICNREVKWEKLLYFADVMGAEYIATGHYAGIVKMPNGRYTVKKALHGEKDQAYMLYRLSQEQLARTLFPLADMSKEEVRSIAEEAQLPVARKPDSQEICFVPDGSYALYIKANALSSVPGEGPFVDEEGNVLGTHKGIIHYTVGQRRGLELPLGYPAYVKEIRAESNEVVIGREESLYTKEIFLGDVNMMSIPGLAPGESVRCDIKIRYRHPGKSATVYGTEDGGLMAVFDEPVKAAAPGQSAVMYDAEGCLIGGGVILKRSF